MRLEAPLPVVTWPRVIGGRYIFKTGDGSLLSNAVLGIAAGGLRVDLNVTGAPPDAAEGQDTYIGTIPGCAWYDTVPHEGDKIHYFDQDPTTNPRFAAIDQLEPPRPWLTAAGMPHIDPRLYFDAGQHFATLYGHIVDSMSAWNEPGGDLYWPPIRFDKYTYDSKGELGDTIRDRFFPEVQNPFALGVTLANPDMLLAGGDFDSADMMARFIAIDGYIRRWKIHPYGDVGGGSYATMAAFRPLLDEIEERGDEWEVGEITADPVTLLKWFRDFAADPINKECKGVTFNDAKEFYEPGTWEIPPGTSVEVQNKWKPVPSAIGLDFGVEFGKINQ